MISYSKIISRFIIIIIIKSVLRQENKNEIYDLILYLKGLGVKRYYLLHEDIIGMKQYSDCFSFPEFWEFYSRLKKDLKGILDIGFVAASGFYKYGIEAYSRCDAGITKIAIMPDGSAFPCNLFSGFHEFRLGNVFKDGIEKIWRNPILDRFRKYDRNKCKIDTCSSAILGEKVRRLLQDKALRNDCLRNLVLSLQAKRSNLKGFQFHRELLVISEIS